MIEVRFSSSDEIARLKQIWKRCFGDSDRYIDFFYNNRYKPEETIILLDDGEIATMLVTFPMRIMGPDGRSFSTMYLYAFGTDPKFRGRGFGTQIISFADRHLSLQGLDTAITVPADDGMFEYFGREGYTESFFMREARIWRKEIRPNAFGGEITKALPVDYNVVRNGCLAGTLHVQYDDEAMEYQKKLSVEAGADIYIINVNGVTGCATLEINEDGAVFVKELLLPDEYLQAGLALISDILPVDYYNVRTPAFAGENLGGKVRHYGMIKWYRSLMQVERAYRGQGYMAFAYD
ncbi:MAG: hypothetical protein H6Q73_1602 [Firmicutes bacterium]|nr:hypothetical protein [Bacillota bacterium]